MDSEENRATKLLAQPSRPGSGSSDGTVCEVLNKWLAVFSRLFDKKLEEIDFEIYLRLLGDISPLLLGRACERAASICKFFPKPGDIREHIDRTEQNALQIKAEREWEYVLVWVRRWLNPDGGLYRGAPELSPVTFEAANAAGGLEYIEYCPRSDLVWAKKRFVEHYITIHETRKNEPLLTDRQAKKLLQELCGRAARMLASPKSEAESSSDEIKTVTSESKPILKMPAPGPEIVLSDEEWATRKRRNDEAVMQAAVREKVTAQLVG